MNINPYGVTTPHYDSYEDFYKFFEVYPKEASNVPTVEVFPPVEVTIEKIKREEKDKKESTIQRKEKTVT